MSNPAQVYAQAVRTLRPNSARMAAARAELQAARQAADAAIDAALAQGCTVRGLYDLLQTIRPAPGQPDPAAITRATLLGRLRREPALAQ